jgi:hypothetical protein
LTVVLPQAGLAQGNGKGKGHNKQADRDDDNRDRDSDRGDKRGFASYSAHAIMTRFAATRTAIRTCRQDWPNSTETCLRDCRSGCSHFRRTLERRLPPLPDTYRRVTLGVDILILDRRTQRIVDVIHDILRP